MSDHSPARPGALAAFAQLTKLRISIASTLTAATGFVAAQRGVTLGILPATLGTVLLAMAASALNEVQERDVDALMERTRMRPIPHGDVRPATAVALALALMALGVATLWRGAGATSAAFGVLALVWYNGVYTPLKRRTAFAVVPGSLIGALPPLIGWTAAGGDPLHPAIVALAAVLFVWQVPHFWLLSLLHGEGYEAAGFPTLRRHFDANQIIRLIFTWTAATVATSALMPLFRSVVGLGATVLLGLGGVWLLVRFAGLLRGEPTRARIFGAFMDINRYALVLMGAVVLDALGLR